MDPGPSSPPENTWTTRPLIMMFMLIINVMNVGNHGHEHLISLFAMIIILTTCCCWYHCSVVYSSAMIVTVITMTYHDTSWLPNSWKAEKASAAEKSWRRGNTSCRNQHGKSERRIQWKHKCLGYIIEVSNQYDWQSDHSMTINHNQIAIIIIVD